MTDPGDLLDTVAVHINWLRRDDPLTNRADSLQSADYLERLAAELAAARTAHYTDDPDYQDWLNELGDNMPEHYDGDDAMEAIVLRYVRDLEAIRTAAVAVAWGAEGAENMDTLRSLLAGSTDPELSP